MDEIDRPASRYISRSMRSRPPSRGVIGRSAVGRFSTATLFDFSPRPLRNGRDRALFGIYFVAICAFAFALQISGLSIGRWGLDSVAHTEAVTSGQLGSVGVSAADYVVMVITPYLKIGPFYNGVTTLCLAFLMARLSWRAGLMEKAVMLFATFPIFFQLQFVSKESIVVLYITILFVIFSFSRSDYAKIALVVSSFIIFAYFFRNYYIISLLFACCLYFSRFGFVQLLSIPASLIAVSLIKQLRDPLMDARWFVYYGASDDVASRVPLHFLGDSWYDFLGNYVFTLLSFIFPLLINLRIQEIYMQIYSIVNIFLIVGSFKRGNLLLTSLFVGIILTLPLFVPDVGTFARHISATSPLLFLAYYFGSAKRFTVPAVRPRRTERAALMRYQNRPETRLGSSLVRSARARSAQH